MPTPGMKRPALAALASWPSHVKSATFKQDATAAWYVTLVVHFELADLPLPPPAPERVAGLARHSVGHFAYLPMGQCTLAPLWPGRDNGCSPREGSTRGARSER